MNRLAALALLLLVSLNVFSLTLLRARFDAQRDQLAATRCEVRTDPTKAPLCRAHCVWEKQVADHQSSEELPLSASTSISLDYLAPEVELSFRSPVLTKESTFGPAPEDFYRGTFVAPGTPPPLA